MPFNANIPQPTDLLDASQADLLSNFQALDSTFGIDHFPFSDLTANLGFHNQVTTPQFNVTTPNTAPTTTTNPIFYANEITTPVGLLQFSRGPSDRVPSPITTLQSPSTAITLTNNSTTNVLDFTGLTRSYGVLYATSNLGAQLLLMAMFNWNGTTLTFKNIIGGGNGSLTPSVNVNILQLLNSNTSVTLDVFWTLQFERVV